MTARTEHREIEVNAFIAGELSGLLMGVLETTTFGGEFFDGRQGDHAVLRLMVEAESEEIARLRVTDGLLAVEGVIPLDVRPEPLEAIHGNPYDEERFEAFLGLLPRETQAAIIERAASVLVALFGPPADDLS
jgi:hypothetical protein